MQHLIKRFLDQNFKSSQKFGRLAESSNSVKELFRERRFLYFTKKGPIEIVFNLKHYISAFVLSIVFVIKMLQLIFFGVSSFFSYVSYKNDEIVKTFRSGLILIPGKHLKSFAVDQTSPVDETRIKSN